jgi:hypothetical protein
MSITSKVKQSVILAADGQVQSLVAGSAANITKCKYYDYIWSSNLQQQTLKLNFIMK